MVIKIKSFVELVKHEFLGFSMLIVFGIAIYQVATVGLKQYFDLWALWVLLVLYISGQMTCVVNKIWSLDDDKQ